jgi:OPA family glycerol-3-phosphate transporter-like MFS transporter/OPA family sugar phosphate sensor protein UhpC-like MFS transporter
MAVGLIGSAILNICFGFSHAVFFFGVIWMLNGWVQGMGFPPCARLLTHWFRPSELATKMSIWNTSHGLGTVAVLLLCGFLVDHYKDWRLCFFVPAALATVTAVLLMIFLRDTPASVGLAPVAPEPDAHVEHEEPTEPIGRTLNEYVFSNGYIWVFAFANFFVYVIRYAVLDWGPTMLKQTKGVTLAHASMMTAAFEIAGVVGAMCAGWLTDRLFGGRAARMCVFCMVLCAASLFAFSRVPPGHTLASTATLMASGFFVYGPQALVGIAAANLGTKRAAAAAVGLTGLFGYASTVLSGWGLGWLVDHYDWGPAFAALFVTAGVATLLFLLAWHAPRDGYRRSAIS